MKDLLNTKSCMKQNCRFYDTLMEQNCSYSEDNSKCWIKESMAHDVVLADVQAIRARVQYQAEGDYSHNKNTADGLYKAVKIIDDYISEHFS